MRGGCTPLLSGGGGFGYQHSRTAMQHRAGRRQGLMGFEYGAAWAQRGKGPDVLDADRAKLPAGALGESPYEAEVFLLFCGWPAVALVWLFWLWPFDHL